MYLWLPSFLSLFLLRLSFITPALCNPTILRKHSRYSFPTPVWFYIRLFPSFISPQILWKVDLSEKQTNKSFIPTFSQLTWMKHTRAKASTVRVRTPIGLNSSCISEITRWMSLPPFHTPCHVRFLDLEDLRREVFSAVNQFFLFSLSSYSPGLLFSVVSPYSFTLASFSISISSFRVLTFAPLYLLFFSFIINSFYTS